MKTSLLSFMNSQKRDIRILIINGVNLSQLGTREVNLYGHLSFEDYLVQLRADYPDIQMDYIQSDILGELCSAISNSEPYDAVVLNAGAYTHTSPELADAVRSTTTPVIEVHISNLFGRERYRRHSELAAHCAGFICGFGLDSYRLALESILHKKNSHS